MVRCSFASIGNKPLEEKLTSVFRSLVGQLQDQLFILYLWLNEIKIHVFISWRSVKFSFASELKPVSGLFSFRLVIFLAEMPESAEAPRDEVMPLTVVAQRGDQDRRDETCKPVASRVRRMISYVRNDDSYRVLAIFSIICGISCIGMKALISSVKVMSLIEPDRKIRPQGILKLLLKPVIFFSG